MNPPIDQTTNDTQTWSIINGLVTWLDTNSSATGDTARLLRALKLYEELGEVAEALQDLTSTDSSSARFTWQDAHTELCDVIVTGMVALASLAPSPQSVLEARRCVLANLPTLPNGNLWAAAQSITHPDDDTSVVGRTLRMYAYAGGVAEAVHGAMAGNPRKGASHTWTDVGNRIADVVLQAMSMLTQLTPDAEKIFTTRIGDIATRSGIPA